MLYPQADHTQFLKMTENAFPMIKETDNFFYSH